MADTRSLQSHIYLKIDGVESDESFQRDLLQCTVDLDMDQPAMATVVLNDSRLHWIDLPGLWPGKSFEILVDDNNRKATLFEGEVVGIEPSFAGGLQRLTVRAFDRLHRLTRGRRTNTWLNVSESDVLREIAGRYGLKLEAELPASVSDHILQHNQSDYEFLKYRATRYGLAYWVSGKTLYIRKAATPGAEIPMEWGKTLSTFAPRLSTHLQVDGVTVRGWDPKARREVIGKATTPNGTNNNSAIGNGQKIAKEAHGVEAFHYDIDRSVFSQDEAEAIAQAKLEALTRSFVTAEGSGTGNPAIKPGVIVNITAVGDRFSGKYYVTGVTHRYMADGGFTTTFRATHNPSSSLLSLVTGADANPGNHAPRVYLGIGIVTDNQDPDDLGRVKVMFPTLSDEHTSYWTRVAAPGAGAERGIQWIPEVDDEVLVGFPFGDISIGVVLGGLWNGVDKPPLSTGDAIAGGKVEKRVIKSRSGHIVTMDDNPSGGGITIEDAKGNKIFLDTQKNSLFVTVQRDIEISAQGNIKIAAQGQLEITAAGGAKVETSASLDLKGAIVNIN
ncbi:MAG: type IV secretion protein Rhs [Chloroflexi bacterium]|nr:MAG: type IV secretion protein Rhs [Chloroflexota bacterium]